eukprot:CAMPEP_0170955206 /NCGR_PEP_ID=MMETSP0735-20130129/33029_1 /TAXON_ID=186038 /ORGANISM="Fragilariopsis kerguelensis, Strain L26-C5" /LENGTH=264 /DNA_ID=CAMNT_0011367009 /DNA_START=14 /DNA_END=805 /DNA_ORIENTATION=-
MASAAAACYRYLLLLLVVAYSICASTDYRAYAFVNPSPRRIDRTTITAITNNNSGIPLRNLLQNSFTTINTPTTPFRATTNNDNNDNAIDIDIDNDEQMKEISTSGGTRAATITLASSLDSFDSFGKWALSYADLSPATETSPVGIVFLATNIAYAVAGAVAVANGKPLLGALTEMASVASFAYHYFQLKASSDSSVDRTVKFALFIDYVIAFTGIFMGDYVLYQTHALPSTDLVLSVIAALSFLGFSWIWETGYIYIFNHSMW